MSVSLLSEANILNIENLVKQHCFNFVALKNPMIFFKFSKVLFSVVGSLDKKLVGTSIEFIFSVLFI